MVEKEQQTLIVLEIKHSEEKQKEQSDEAVNKVTYTTQYPAKSTSDNEDDDSSSGSSDSDDMESDLLALLNDRETSLARQKKAAESALTDKCHSGNTLSAPLKITPPPSKSVLLKKVMSGKKPSGPLKAHSHNGATHHMKFGSHTQPTSPPKVTHHHHRSPHSLPSATWKVNATRDGGKGQSKENADWIGHQHHRKSLLRKQRHSSQWIVEDVSAYHRQSRKLSSKRKREPSLTRQLR
jgi:hypothetical protein